MRSAAKQEWTRFRAGAYSHFRPRHVARLLPIYLRNLRGERAYRVLSAHELLATRRSDTAFVFGSGRSLLDISPREWEQIADCDTISLREFPRQHWVPAAYHLTGEVDELEPYARRLRENPLYAETIFVVQGGYFAHMGNELVGRRLLPTNARVFRYRRRSRWRSDLPSRSVGELVHGPNSIFDATNFAYAMGYRRIVLAGADYYNKEYFWLGAGESRQYEAWADATASWPQAAAVVELMGSWCDELHAVGVQLAVYNPRSLLAERLPVFRF